MPQRNPRAVWEIKALKNVPKIIKEYVDYQRFPCSEYIASSMHVCMYVYMYVCMHVCVRVHACQNVCMYECMYVVPSLVSPALLGRLSGCLGAPLGCLLILWERLRRCRSDLRWHVGAPKESECVWEVKAPKNVPKIIKECVDYQRFPCSEYVASSTHVCMHVCMYVCMNE